MQNDIEWISSQDAIELNRAIVAETGESHFLRDINLLEGALARPIHRSMYGGVTDLVDLAIVTMLAIGQNHPFEQGNKRTAFAAFQAFLNLNGIELIEADSEAVGLFVERVILEQLTIEQACAHLAAALGRHTPLT